MDVGRLRIRFAEGCDLADEVLVVLKQVLEFPEIPAEIVQCGNDVSGLISDLGTLQ